MVKLLACGERGPRFDSQSRHCDFTKELPRVDRARNPVFDDKIKTLGT